MVYYEEILDEFKKLSVDKQIIKLFEKVRDIPYGDISPRSPENTWHHKVGTCSTKNLLLREIYLAIGVPVQIWMCSFAFYSSKRFGHEMNILLDNPVIAYHTFLKIEINGSWFIVDATHDLELKKAGFQVTEHWDGKSDTNLAVKPIEYFQVNDVDEFKHKMNAKISESERQRKNHFMELFFQWVQTQRKQ